MTHVIAEPCVNVKDKACVDVCPVDCIHGGDDDPQLLDGYHWQDDFLAIVAAAGL